MASSPLVSEKSTALLEIKTKIVLNFKLKKAVKMLYNKIAATEFKNQSTPPELSCILFKYFFNAVNALTNFLKLHYLLTPTHL